MALRRYRCLPLAEKAAWALGLAGLVSWGTFHLVAGSAMRYDLDRFAAIQAMAVKPGTPDQSLWSPERIIAWRQTLKEPAHDPMAVLRIPKIQLEVAVLPGTDDRTLDRAVGHIEGTALPGADGNIGIAGHRDGFFRGLKDIAAGDAIELETLHGTIVYRVERTWVVDPSDVSVLDPTPVRTLTLVTCFPFYHVGPAPQRFIVRAARQGDEQAFAPLSSARVPCLWCPGSRPMAVFRPFTSS